MPSPLPPDQIRVAPANGTSLAHPTSCMHGDDGNPAATADGFVAVPALLPCDAAPRPSRQNRMPGSEIPGTRKGKSVDAVLG